MNQLSNVVLLFLLSLIVLEAKGSLLRRRLSLFGRLPRTSSHICSSPPPYETRYFEQRLDHFNRGDDRKFQQRYLYSSVEWDGKGPIFVYTGNEGDIVWLYNNTGFTWDLAATYHGLLIFIEHRYYGESLPFGPLSYQDPSHLNYLSSGQALADYATVIIDIKKQLNTSVPVIAVGGSYGGMLAAWLRMKYPNVVLGSLAASAPIWFFTGLTPCNSSYVTITRDFTEATPGYPTNPYLCSNNIYLSWLSIASIAKHDDGLSWLSKTFHLCQPLKSATELTEWLQETWFNIAMVDYPYPANFLEPLPAWPINKTCEILSRKFDFDEPLLEAVAESLSVYYNSSGQASCYNTTSTVTSSLGSRGWDYQACTEMVMPMCSDGQHDMFMNITWNLTAYQEDCFKEFGVKPDPYWVETAYGGKNIEAHSNIVFSNGALDPWSGGGVLQSLSKSLVAVVIPKGAHHLDLRAPDSLNDPDYISQARQLEKNYISQWLDEYYSRKSFI